MRIFFAVCLFSILSLGSYAQESTSSSFSVEVLSFQTDPFSDSLCRVDVYAAVPYSILTFLNAVENYVADYSVDVTIEVPRTDSVAVGKEQSHTITLPSGDWQKLQELDLTRAAATQYSFVLEQRRTFRVVITVIDLSSRSRWTVRKDFSTPQFTSTEASTSTPLLYRSKTGSRISPYIGDDVSALNLAEAGMFFELYNADQSVPMWFMQRLSSAENEQEEITHRTNVIVSTGSARMPVFVPLFDDDLWTGKYVLETYLLADVKDTSLTDPAELKRKALSSYSRTIEVTADRGIPIAGIDIDEAIEQLTYIATGQAYDSLMRADTKQEKRNAIAEFWRGYDPYPNDGMNRPMQVFYKRVQYANQAFRGGLPGWRTDRGRVYIQLGEPTAIDKRPYEVSQRPYELWEYYDLNVRYYFIDQFLVGDYRLASLPPTNGIFHWQRDAR